MNRYASVYRIRPELLEEYKRCHDNIWPEMAEAIRDSGITNYSIFYRGDGTLFAYFECDDAARASACIRKQAVNDRWQAAMERFFIKSDRTIKGPETEDLQEIFHLE
jgi:L-rhamnose mutarotase